MGVCREIILALVIKRWCHFQGSPDATRSGCFISLFSTRVWVVAVLTNSMLVFSAFEYFYLSPKDNIALRQADLAWREAVSNYCTLSRGKWAVLAAKTTFLFWFFHIWLCPKTKRDEIFNLFFTVVLGPTYNTACFSKGGVIRQTVKTRPLAPLNWVKTEAFGPYSKIFQRAVWK